MQVGVFFVGLYAYAPASFGGRGGLSIRLYAAAQRCLIKPVYRSDLQELGVLCPIAANMGEPLVGVAKCLSPGNRAKHLLFAPSLSRWRTRVDTVRIVLTSARDTLLRGIWTWKVRNVVQIGCDWKEARVLVGSFGGPNSCVIQLRDVSFSFVILNISVDPQARSEKATFEEKTEMGNIRNNVITLQPGSLVV